MERSKETVSRNVSVHTTRPRITLGTYAGLNTRVTVPCVYVCTQVRNLMLHPSTVSTHASSRAP